MAARTDEGAGADVDGAGVEEGAVDVHVGGRVDEEVVPEVEEGRRVDPRV